jgi:hypothetical protein
MLLAAKHAVDSREEIIRDVPLADQPLDPRVPGRLRDSRLSVRAQQDHPQSRAAGSKALNQPADVSACERQVYDRQPGSKPLRALEEGPLVGYHHNRVELRSEKGSNALGEAGMGSRQKDGRRHSSRL